MSEEENLIELSFNDIFENDIQIRQAGKYEVVLKKGVSLNDLFLYSSGLSAKKINGEILVNGFSVSNDNFARRYLQQNALFLSGDTFLFPQASVYQQLKAISLMYGGYNLADAGISSFSINELRDRKISTLNKEERKIIILSFVVVCPSLIWFIHKDLLNSLPKKFNDVFENALNIRIKHGGACLIVA